MTEIWVVIIFIFWYSGSLLISEFIGKKRKIGSEWSFFFGMVFSPVAGLLISLLSKKR